MLLSIKLLFDEIVELFFHLFGPYILLTLKWLTIGEGAGQNKLLLLTFFSAGRYEVVAIGTGEYNYSQGIKPDGRVLHDAHAVVTARRSLLR